MDILHCLEQEVAELKDTLQQKEQELYEIKQKLLPTKSAENGKHNSENSTKVQFGDTLPKWAIERYSRQILLPDIGVRGQEKLMAARVLIVGAGGLGCPSSVYLAGAGIGEIGIVDYDQVELTNIHRQILHSEKDQNLSKAQSAANSLRSINSKIKITPYDFDLNPSNALEVAKNYDLILDCTDNVPTRYMLSDVSVLTKNPLIINSKIKITPYDFDLNPSNALEVAKNYDLILDCTDNVPTRYMLSDVSVLSKIPLISGSALKMEGQLTIYGYRAKNNTSEEEKSYIGPCYRCLFPTPPPPEAVGSCSANGVAGPVPGVIGALQALEAIKLIVGQTHKNLLVERMLLFDGDDTTFTTVKLRPRNPECEICSDSPKITTLLDYEVLCKSKAKGKDRNLHILPIENRISAKDLAKSLDAKESHLLVDVRSESEFNMCNIGGAVNYPLEKMNQNQFDELLEKIRECTSYVTFICRRGNDSQIAAKRVLDVLEENQRSRVKDLSGGLHAWSAHVDNDFPVY